MKMVTYEVTLSQENADKLAAKADAAGIVCDLEYLEARIVEWLNDEARLSHTEK